MENLKRDYLHTPFDWIRFWFLVRRIKRAKITQLLESNLDKFFIEEEYGDLLSYNDDIDRQVLADERRLPLKEQQPKKIEALEEKISKAKAVQASNRKNENFRQEVSEYLGLLEKLWKRKD